jgi:hypothetical protein
MHLIVPFASTVSEGGRHALQTLALPQLDQLLARLTPVATLGSDEFSLNTPHELVLAQAWGWPTTADGATGALPTAERPAAALPFAAEIAATLLLPEARSAAWGQLVPVHLHVGSEGVSLTDPQALQLDEAGSRELLDIVRDSFEREGFALHWAAPLQWLASHPSFDALPSASIDRVIGRNVAPWLPDQRAARLVRRLQNEVQMVLYTHTVNDRREAAGLPTVNSLWLSGCGRLPAVRPGAAGAVAAAAANPTLDDRLRGPALAEDWAAWCEAWRALDAGPIAALLRSGDGRLTLCGERLAQTWAPQPRSWWQQLSAGWRKPATHAVLEAL